MNGLKSWDRFGCVQASLLRQEVASSNVDDY